MKETKLETFPMYQYGRDVGRAIKRSPILNAEEEKELITKAQAGDITARDRVVESHLRSVIKVAGQFRRPGIELEDLIQEGNIGLIIAIDRFDTSRGTRLSTYAFWWIRHKIRIYLNDQGRTVRAPVYHQELRMKLERFTLNYIAKYGQKPSDEQVAKKLGMSKKRLLKFYQRELSYCASLTRETDEYDNQYSDEIDLEDRGSQSIDDEVAIAQLVAAIQKALMTLKEICKISGNKHAMRDIKIFMKRLFEDDATLQSIGDEHGISRERVRQIYLHNSREIQDMLRKDGIDANFLEHS